MGSAFFLEVWLARTLGAELYGRWAFIVASAVLFAPVAHLGLESVSVRDLVRGNRHAGETLGTSLCLRLWGGLAAAALVVGFVAVASPSNDRGAMLLATIMASGMIFQSCEVFDYWFQSRVESKYSVLARTLGFGIAGIGKVICIWQRAPLPVFAALSVAELAIYATGLAVCYLRRRLSDAETRLRFSKKAAWQLLRESWPLGVAALAVAAGQRIDQLLLRSMCGTRASGLYAVASQLSEASYFIAVVVVSTLLPSIIRARSDPSTYQARLQKLFDSLAGIALLFSGTLSLLAPILVSRLFGPDYAPAAAVLSINAWTTLFFFLGVAQSAWFLAEGLTRWSGLVIMLGTACNVLLNFWFIPVLGINGAAWAKLISYALSWFILNGVFAKTRPVFFMQARALWPFGRLSKQWLRAA